MSKIKVVPPYLCEKGNIFCVDPDQGSTYTVEGWLLPDWRFLSLDSEQGDVLWESMEAFAPNGHDRVTAVEIEHNTKYTLDLEELAAADKNTTAWGGKSLLTASELEILSRRFTIRYECGTEETFEASSLEAADKEAVDRVAATDYGQIESTIFAEYLLFDWRRKEVEGGTVQIDPLEPTCEHAEGHDWRSPHSLLGGLRENPGVRGNGGGVIIRTACVRCGCGKTVDTWANNSRGEQGYQSVSYEVGEHVIGPELDAIHWTGGVGRWCDRWFARGVEGSFDTEELARAACPRRTAAGAPGAQP